MTGKLAGVTLIILFCLPVFTTLSANNQSRLTIRVGGYDNPPKVFPDTNGNYIGIFPDLLTYIANKENWNLVWVTCEWSDCLQKLKSNDINVMIDVGYSDQRAQEYDFNTVPVISNWAQSYSRSDRNYTSVEDLQGSNIAVLNGSIHTDGPNGIKALLNKFNISVNYLEVQTYKEVMELVNNKTADFGITNRLFGLDTESDYPQVKRSFLIFDPVDLYFAFNKGSALTKQLIPIFDKDLIKLENDPNSEYFVILNRYLFNLETHETIPSWLIPLLAVVFSLIVLLLAFNFIFKHQLDIRTKELQNLVKHQDEEIKKQTKVLMDSNERLKEVDKLKSIFLASMSHELRTPLNSIIGFTKILLLGMTGELNEEQKKQLSLVENNSQYLLELINDILDISKIESGTVQLNYESFNLNKLLEEQLELAKPLIKGKELQISINMEDQLVITSDMRRLKQIIYNILSNAIKFSEKGTISINMRKKSENYFEISIEDQGVGIKEKDLKSVFQPFYQIESSSQKKFEGTGLGLYICSKLVKLLDGDLSVTSKYGKGTNVTFYLPIQGGE